MTDEDKKVLTGYIGKCWHEDVSNYDNGKWHKCSCDREWEMSHAGSISFAKHIEESNHSFATTADLYAVYSSMVELGEWDEFWAYANSHPVAMPGKEAYYHDDFAKWLFCLNAPGQIPERMAMAANFIREMGK